MELFRALAVVAEPPSEETRRVLSLLELEGAVDPSVYTDLFAFQLYPYASVYLGGEGMLGGEARDRIAGFWRAIGEVPPTEPDHLAVLLALYARLCELAAGAGQLTARAAWSRARAALLWEHLLSWLPVFLAKLDDVAPEPYRGWGRVVARALDAEAEVTDTPPMLSQHLRDAPPYRPGRERHELLDQLLAPVRSGMILTRTDLARGAHELGVGLRAGERRYVLGAFLDQDAEGTLAWLAMEAERAARQHTETIPYEGVSRFWASRAHETETSLRALILEGASHA